MGTWTRTGLPARTVQAGEASLARVIGSTLGDEERAVLLQACALIDGISESLSVDTLPLQASVAARLPRRQG